MTKSSRATARDRPYYTRACQADSWYSRGDPLRSPWLLKFALMGASSRPNIFCGGDMPRAPAGAMVWHIPRLIFKALHCVPTYFRCLSSSERTVRYDSIIHYDVIHLHVHLDGEDGTEYRHL